LWRLRGGYLEFSATVASQKLHKLSLRFLIVRRIWIEVPVALIVLSRRLKQLIDSIVRPEKNKASGLRIETDASGNEPIPDAFPLSWDYSRQYQDIVTEGGRKPPPAFGSPTFVWHVGIWQKMQGDESGEDSSLLDRRYQIASKYNRYDEHNEKFFMEVSAFIQRLQEKGRILWTPSPDAEPGLAGGAARPNIDEFSFKTYERRVAALRRISEGKKVAHQFRDYEPQSLGFNLWWQDSLENGSPVPNRRAVEPAYSAIRVRVQVVSHVDHVTLSFFIDAAKPYGHPQVYSTQSRSRKDFGFRRSRIAECLDHLRRISDNQIKKGYTEQDRIPEKGVDKDDAKLLEEIADYFYDGVWRDFMSSFGISVEGGKPGRLLIEPVLAERESEGEIFINYRGVVMSVPGLQTPRNIARERRAEELKSKLGIPESQDKLEGSANVSIGAFPIFDQTANEPNTVLKSYWPFMRRATPWADYRDAVGCGITDWRSLLLTFMGTSGSFYGDDESKSREYEVPNLKEAPEGTIDGNRPLTYLILTKGEPHREQIGRFVERINALGTNQLFALKNLKTIKNAGTHLRLLGRELDGILEYWGDERKRIEDEHEWKLLKLSNPRLENIEEIAKREGESRGRKRTRRAIEKSVDYGVLILRVMNGEFGELGALSNSLQAVPHADVQVLHDERVKKLSDLVKLVERRLVELGGALDNIGNGGAGRILYVINRAKLHMDEFERMWPTLEIGNIDGWINYGQYAQRGVLPSFTFIRSTADRLVSLRQRLQSITEMIQTSALIIETEATRSNTEILRRILSNMWFLAVPISLVFSALILKDKAAANFDLEYGVRLTLAAGIPAIFLLQYHRKKKEAEKAESVERAASHLDIQRLFRSILRKRNKRW
jgi:hypothetical protein